MGTSCWIVAEPLPSKGQSHIYTFIPRYATLYSTASPDHSSSVTFVVRPSTISLRPTTSSPRYATLMTRSLPSTEDLWRFATIQIALTDHSRYGTFYWDLSRPLTIATAFILRHHYDEPRVATFTLRAHKFNEKHTFCHVLFKRFKMNVSTPRPPTFCQELVGSIRFSYDTLHVLSRVAKFAQIVAERVARTCRCDHRSLIPCLK